MTLNIGKVTITPVACALILGIIVNLLVNIKSKKSDAQNSDATSDTVDAAQETTATTEKSESAETEEAEEAATNTDGVTEQPE